ncbi:MAG: phosphatase PAP2 family protein [Nanopusillaceae archaeon]
MVIILLGWITPNILQKLFNRERPYYFFKIEINYKTPPYRSFPSSHTFLSILIFLTMYKAKVNPILAILIFSIPILRIISLQHWFSDIVFSIALSTMLYSIFSALILGII